MRNKNFVKFRKPVRVNQYLTNKLRHMLRERGIQVPGEWQIFVTDTKRGRSAPRSETLTVPVWAMEGLPNGTPDEEYCIYYATHEISHILAPARRNDVHGPRFMAAFKSVCPEHLWHHELGYKPRLAAAAGIRKEG